MNKNNSVILRIINATKFSYQGLLKTFETEAAFRQECYIGIIAIPVSFWLANTIIEWILLIASFLLIIITELLNSAIEAAVDRLGNEQHELSGKAKDAGSAAVFIAITSALIIWLSIALF